MTTNLDEVDPVDTEPDTRAACRSEPLSLDQTDLVHALVLLRDKLSEIVVRATTEGPRNCPWADLAAVLDSAATLCRHQASLEPLPRHGREPQTEVNAGAPGIPSGASPNLRSPELPIADGRGIRT